MPKTTNQVICKLQKAGLENQLFPLLKGYVFARLNHLPILVLGFNYLKNRTTPTEANMEETCFEDGLIVARSQSHTGLNEIKISKPILNTK